jgi:hypothetical protein
LRTDVPFFFSFAAASGPDQLSDLHALFASLVIVGRASVATLVRSKQNRHFHPLGRVQRTFVLLRMVSQRMSSIGRAPRRHFRFWWEWKGDSPKKDVLAFIGNNYPSHWTYADFAHQFRAELFGMDVVRQRDRSTSLGYCRSRRMDRSFGRIRCKVTAFDIRCSSCIAHVLRRLDTLF